MEREEFKRIWLPLDGSLYRVAFSILGSEADAKDAVQDLYLKLWNRRESLSEVDRPLGYGIRLIRNICIDRLRARNARGTGEDISSVGETDMTDSVSADSKVVDREMLSALHDVMARLPDNQRKVVEMRFFRQLGYDEISERTGLSAVNVRVLVNRARNTIVSSLKRFV